MKSGIIMNYKFTMVRKSTHNCYKRSQITVFAIIGVIMLLTFGILITIKGFSKTPYVDPNAHADDVVLYVNTCLEDIAAEGIKNIGFGAGYLNRVGEENPNVAMMDPIGSDSFPLFGGIIELPYLRYFAKDRAYCFG